MFLVGDLKDKEMGDRIILLLKEREILGHLIFNDREESYFIFVENEAEVTIAKDIYLTSLGFKKPIEIDQEWIKIKSVPNGSFTMAIIAICLFIYICSFFSFGTSLYSALMISGTDQGFLKEITAGQIYRLVTPIFLHMNFLHILFNLLWFKDLSNVFEYSLKVPFTLFFILIVGISSNLFQYIYMGPKFGGMSGVLYGMLAFLWLNKKINFDLEFSIPKHDVIVMMGWFVICLVGIIPNVANYAHAGGIAFGMMFAIFRSFKFEWRRMMYLLMAIGILILTVIISNIGKGV